MAESDDEPAAPPRSDRRALQQVIAGLTDGVILVEADQTIAWANEAALAMHGVADVAGLGGTVDGYRSLFELRFRNNHPLPPDRYPLDRVISGETFDDVTVEVSPAADPEQRWVHTIRSLVVTTSSGAPDMLVLIVKDETERFQAEERFDSAFNANPAPALICRLEDQRYVRVNQGFIEMTGHVRERVIGRTVREIDVFNGAAERERAYERLDAGAAITQMEAELALPEGGTRSVIVAGQPIEIGDEAYMLFTFADLEGRRRAETALKQSEQRFATSFRLSPAPGAISKLKDFAFTEANEAFLALSGYPDVELVGRNAADIGLWEDAVARRAFEATLKETGAARNLPLRMKTRDGARVDCVVSAEAVTINDEPCVLWVCQDVTERKRSEDELIAAIESVMADTSWFGRTIVERLANLRHASRGEAPGAALDDLSAREREILGLISGGADNKQISGRLNLSPHTVRNHVASLFRKIGVNRRAAAVVWARERGVKSLSSEPETPAPRKK